MKKSIVFFVLMMFINSYASAQENKHNITVSIEEFTQKQGLPQGYVTSIVQDKNGFIWVATKLGISRYDGYKFITFQNNPKDTNSISSNFVRSLAVDEHNNLWIVSNDGNLDVLDLKYFKFYHAISPNKSPFIGNYFFQNNSFTSPILRITEKVYKCKFSLVNDVPKFEFIDLKLTIPMQGGLSYIFNPRIQNNGDLIYYMNNADGAQFYVINTITLKTRFVAKTTEKNIIMLHFLPNSNTIYFSDIYRHFILNLHTKIQTKLSLSTTSGMFFADNKENLWFFDKSEISILKSNTLTTEKANTLGNVNLKNIHELNTCFQDNTNNIFLGLGGYGMLKIFATNTNFNKAELTTDNPAIYKFFTNNSQFVYTFHNQGMLNYNIATSKIQYSPWIKLSQAKNIKGLGTNVLYNNKITSFCTNNTVHEFDVNTKKDILIVKKSLHLDGEIMGVFTLNNGHYYTINLINNKPHLSIYNENYDFIKRIKFSDQYFNNTNHTFYNYHLIDENTIAIISTAGITIINTKKNSYEEINTQNYLPNQNLISSYYNKDENTFWLGTEGAGLIQFNLISKKYKIYTKKEGLPDNVIYGILNHKNTLWLSTNNGLSCFNLGNNTFHNFTQEDGLQDNEFNRFAYAKVNDSTFAFGGIKGLNFFNPNKFNFTTSTRTIGFSSILVNNTEILNSDKLNGINGEYYYQANANENNLQLDFCVFDFFNPSNNQFKYRIVNKDSTWISLENNHILNFSSLKSGDYKIEIKGANSRGLWIEKPIILNLHIATIWYKTWLAYFCYLIILASIVYLIARFRINQIKKLLNLRIQISTDLHDDVGSSISSVNIYNSILKEKIEEKQPELLPLLDKSNGILNEVMENLGDIVWAINPKNDKIENIFTRLEQQVLPLVYEKGYHVNFNVEDSCKNLNLNLQFRKNIYLILKETINNTLKYAAGKNILIHVSASKTEFIIQFSDDGIGYEMNEIKKGNGLMNIEKRMEEIGGNSILKSEKSKGISYLFTIPIANFRH